jgi:hypothetical protein
VTRKEEYLLSVFVAILDRVHDVARHYDAAPAPPDATATARERHALRALTEIRDLVAVALNVGNIVTG